MFEELERVLTRLPMFLGILQMKKAETAIMTLYYTSFNFLRLSSMLHNHDSQDLVTPLRGVAQFSNQSNMKHVSEFLCL